MLQVVKYRRASTHRRDGRMYELAGRLCGHVTHLMRVLEAKLSLIKFATTIAAFAVFICFLPGLLFLYTGIKCWRLCVGWWALRMVDGIEELTGVTVRAVMEEGPDNRSCVETLLFCLSGTPSITYLRKKIQEDILDRKGSDGKILHPNFRRRVERVCGYYAWARHDKFDITQHVLMAPMHYRGRIITTRNIQEYMGEVVSQPLPEDLPPWCVNVVTISDGGTEGEGETWIVARAHHLLAMQLDLPNLLVSAYPDPWQNPATRGLTLLSAPASTLRFIKAVKTFGRTTANTSRHMLSNWWHERQAAIVNPVRSALEESIQVAYKTNPGEEFHLNIFRQSYTVAVFLSIIWKNVHDHINAFIAALIRYCNAEYISHRCFSFISGSMHMIWRAFLWILKFPWTIWELVKTLRSYIKKLLSSKEYNIVKNAFVEIYWMTRAFVTLPRLILEEALSIHGVTPLMGWVGRRQRTLSSRGLGRTGGMALAWSDPVPLLTAKGVRGATGATISEILMTACSGAVRDYLRVTGLPVPDEVCCTVPVYSQHRAKSREETESPGLVTLALPTGASDASSALEIVRKSMEKIRKYPERYLASVWLIRNVVYFLPESLLGAAFRALSVRYPVAMSNLAGPSKSTSIWGFDLLNIFYWRPPQSGSVLSVCVTSYEGRAHLGVLVDGRIVPNAATLPQAFVTHLNELAVDTGVRLVRQCSRSWSRGSSPGNTPSPTPPPTPTCSHKMSFPHWNKLKLSNKMARRQSSVF
ncbi:uncharacterized protein [Macrobrachium rosenbergii]|uniref:uncharacterized protein n=1 Tax=Macrobrachium rosenbergii TaxID=79674 RepID=UPI0034D42F01